jgi:hypothetical protein
MRLHPWPFRALLLIIRTIIAWSCLIVVSTPLSRLHSYPYFHIDLLHLSHQIVNEFHMHLFTSMGSPALMDTSTSSPPSISKWYLLSGIRHTQEWSSHVIGMAENDGLKLSSWPLVLLVIFMKWAEVLIASDSSLIGCRNSANDRFENVFIDVQLVELNYYFF